MKYLIKINMVFTKNDFNNLIFILNVEFYFLWYFKIKKNIVDI